MPQWWPFKKKETQTATMEQMRAAEVTLRREVEAQLAAGQSRQAIFNRVEREGLELEQQPPTPQIKARLYALDILYAELRDELINPLKTGKALEMAGQVDEAMVYYETAVADQVPNRFPYEHLRVIYVRRQQYDDARRICLAATQNPFMDEKAQAHFRAWAERFTG
jgi:hypothetical protein